MPDESDASQLSVALGLQNSFIALNALWLCWTLLTTSHVLRNRKPICYLVVNRMPIW